MRHLKALGFLTFLAIWGSGAWALYWFDQMIGARLSVDARLALPDGRSLFMFLPFVIQVLLGPAPPKFTAARIDPAANRVLQSVWRDPKPLLPPWLARPLVALVVVAVLGLYGATAYNDLKGAGDRAVGFVAGIGIFVLVAGAYTLVGLAGWKLWQATKSLLGPRPTPAPVP